MFTKRASILVGTAVGGALLLGTAGLALAQDPTPSPSPTWGTPHDMMGGRGMMGGQSMMAGRGMADDMGAMHDAMGTGEQCDPARMQSLHQQRHPTD